MSNNFDLKERAEYDSLYYTKGHKRLENGEFASICDVKDSLYAYAHLKTNRRTKAENCYIKTFEGHVIDPYRDGLKFKRSDRFKYKMVESELFDIYIRYLQNGAKHLYNIVERNVGGY